MKFEMRLQSTTAMEVMPAIVDASTAADAAALAQQLNPGWEVFSIWEVAE
ncbi:hypothetical protein FDH86_gp002 [Arthrobacter phage Tank]|uniref:Uncharacterized protein n=2 Tax=Tankvirus tank TaxID=1982567 RepID=A0A0U3TN61_9CAUD|nr:hypothetical protein FDH86_gp002 [Arthrobacter phage Tank]ALY10537.1 hypothetical protein TANK_2 [Arthrobacter phage Tank]ALY10791.1 hypothetical protein WILDE_2 [Arthrobacter phage Wilde]